MDCVFSSGSRPKIMVTNDDGIDAPGLRALVQVLVSTNQYEVLVCAPDSYVLRLFLFSSDHLNSLNLKIVWDLKGFQSRIDCKTRHLWIFNCVWNKWPLWYSCVLVAPFFREKSAVSHSITWRHPLAVKRVEIEGATAYAVSGLFNYW